MSEGDAATRIGAAGLADSQRAAAPIVAYGPGLFWPVLIVTGAFAAWTAFQTLQLLAERTALEAGLTQQETLVQNSTKLRQSLDAMATQTQRLADLGNPNAKLLVDELRKRGVTINANAPAPAASAK